MGNLPACRQAGILSIELRGQERRQQRYKKYVVAALSEREKWLLPSIVTKIKTDVVGHDDCEFKPILKADQFSKLESFSRRKRVHRSQTTQTSNVMPTVHSCKINNHFFGQACNLHHLYPTKKTNLSILG